LACPGGREEEGEKEGKKGETTFFFKSFERGEGKKKKKKATAALTSKAGYKKYRGAHEREKARLSSTQNSANQKGERKEIVP